MSHEEAYVEALPRGTNRRTNDENFDAPFSVVA
jgi:hypothetical protein